MFNMNWPADTYVNSIALDKREHLVIIRDNFSTCFSLKPYVVTLHLNRLEDGSDEGSPHMVSKRRFR